MGTGQHHRAKGLTRLTCVGPEAPSGGLVGSGPLWGTGLLWGTPLVPAWSSGRAIGESQDALPLATRRET